MVLRRLSRIAVLAAVGAGVSACTGLGGAPAAPKATIASTSGDFRVTNSRDGLAIFQATGLAPGGSATGTVQLSNTGSRAGDLSLQQLKVADQPGANGGLLSSRVVLDVTDVTGGGSIPVFAGQIGALGNRTLGSIAPGEVRAYRFTASLPDGGDPPSATTGDNAFAGSGLTVRYAWTAAAPDDPGGSGGGNGGGNNNGGGGGGGNGGGNPAGAPIVKFSVVSKQALTRGWLDVMASCDRVCKVDARAQLPKPKAKKVKKGKRKKAAKAISTRPRLVTLTVLNKSARIRLSLGGKGKKQLKQALRTKKKVAVTVSLTVTSAAGTDARTYTKKVAVKRPKKEKKKR